jgi:hypothetical protein
MIFIYIILGIFLLYCVLDLCFGKRENYGITFIAGEIGAGKTCYSTKLAQKYIKNGWKVFTNYNCRGCYVLEPERLINYCYPEKSVIILDEASLEHNSRNFAKISLKLIEYYKLSRHYKNKVILISQTFTDTDKQIRDLSDNVYFIRKVIHSLISMPVSVKGKLDIDHEGQPTVKYKIGKVGVPFLLPRYYKLFNSFDKPKRDVVKPVKWSDYLEALENSKVEEQKAVS